MFLRTAVGVGSAAVRVNASEARHGLAARLLDQHAGAAWFGVAIGILCTDRGQTERYGVVHDAGWSADASPFTRGIRAAEVLGALVVWRRQKATAVGYEGRKKAPLAHCALHGVAALVKLGSVTHRRGRYGLLTHAKSSRR